MPKIVARIGFILLLMTLPGRWNAAEAQFSTIGFDTVIIEKQSPDAFIYWFNEPFEVQAHMFYGGIGPSWREYFNTYRYCRWQILTSPDEFQMVIDFRIKVEEGVDLTQGMSYLIPNHENLQDPAAAAQAPVAMPTYVEPAFNGRWGYRLETKSPMRISRNAGDSITATLYSRPETDQPFRGILNQARRAGEKDLPVLGHARYEPTLRDVGMVVEIANRKYALLCSGAQRRAWLFRDDLLLAMFQYDLDHIPGIPAPAYDFRIEPYMFVRPQLPQADQKQIPLLLMMARAAAELVKDKRYF